MAGFCRRAKILVLVALLFLAIYISKADVPRISYYSSKSVSYCISGHDSRTSAIGWIYPEGYDVATATKFYPQLKSSYNTNFQTAPSTEWALDGWRLSNWDSISPILDTRWEDLNIVTSGEEFKHTNEATFAIKSFPISFSVRGDSAEILLCEGWNPEEFASYVIALGGPDRNTVLFGHVEKYKSKIDYSELQTTFKYDNFMVSKDSWKSFHLKYNHDNGILELETIIDDKPISIIKITISQKLKPLYFLTRSLVKPAEWKFEERRFLYTNATGEVKFGPELSTPSEEICVSLYLSLCKFCAIDFYFYNNESVVYLKKGFSGEQDSKEKEWKEVRLLKFDNLADSIQIYVNTSFTGGKHSNETGFWAVDEIRVCSEDEIKISSIASKKSDLFTDSVTCQSLKHPRWRPKREKLPPKPSGESLKITKVTSTSITFKRTAMLTNVYSYNYKALGAKQCSMRYKDPFRQKSNGFLVVSGNEVVFNNLIPYTHYTIIVTDAIYNINETYNVLTSEAQTISDSELPENLSIKTRNTSMLITWDRLNCTMKRGAVVYNVNILENGILVKTYLQDTNRYQISGLNSFTNYTVEIITARNKDLHTNSTVKSVYYAQTLPGAAGKVERAEFYSVDEKSLLLRYDLPKRPNGVPVEVQYTICQFHILKMFRNCLMQTGKLVECKLWKGKYCIGMDSLLANTKYYARITLRNNDTNYFGEEVVLNATTGIRAPAPPANLNYSIIVHDNKDNMCHINITWEHPYYQIAPIRLFDIMITSMSDDDNNYESIKEIYYVKDYLPVYSKIIKYIDFSTTYNISIRSQNLKYSPYTSIIIKTDHVGKYINQSPELIEITPTTVSYSIPILDRRLSSYLLIAIVQDDRPEKPPENLKRIAEDDLCRDYGDAWIASITEILDDGNYSITIGESSNSSVLSVVNETVDNKALSPETDYCVTFVITNRHLGKEHVVVYHSDFLTTLKEEELVQASSSIIPVIFGTLFTIVGFVIAAWAARKFWRQRRMRKNVSNNDPIYMSLESLPRAVSNETYDKLITD